MVEDDEVASVQGFRKSIPPGRCLVALCVGIPQAMVGVEVTHDEGVIIVGGEEQVKVGAVYGGTGGCGRDIDVVDIEGRLAIVDGEPLVLDGRVTREEVVCGKGGV